MLIFAEDHEKFKKVFQLLRVEIHYGSQIGLSHCRAPVPKTPIHIQSTHGIRIKFESKNYLEEEG